MDDHRGKKRYRGPAVLPPGVMIGAGKKGKEVNPTTIIPGKRDGSGSGTNMGRKIFVS